MSRRARSELPKGLQILFRHGRVSREMQHGVLQGAGVSVGQDESIAVDPRGVGGAVGHDLGPEHVGHGRAAHGSTGVARIGGLRLIGRYGANCIDAALFQSLVVHRHGRHA